MENFVYDIPTKVYFGKDQLQVLSSILPTYGKRVLLVYGGGSIHKNGIYNEICTQLQACNIYFTELSGVEPNPRIETIRKGVALCEQHQIDVILPVGGGSVIDCAKVIAASYGSYIDAWELIENANRITAILPVIVVLTLAATGSEMDGIAVVSDMKKREKKPLKHPLLRPKVAILDPCYTIHVSKQHTAAGIADILSHLMETYFSIIEGYMQERMCEGLMKTCIHCGLTAYQKGDDYEARANLMWAGTWAINDFLKLGRPVTWSVHAIEHQLSGYYDITHGIGLAILTPYWMEYVMNEKTAKMFAQFARNVWGVEEIDDIKAAKLGIVQLKAFYQQLQLPKTLQEVGIHDTTCFEEMAEKAMPYLNGTYYPMRKEDVIQIYKNSYDGGIIHDERKSGSNLDRRR